MKRYLITGASRGIGRAIAEKLAANDVQLLLHGRDTVALAKVCDSINDRCARVVRLIHDLAIPSGISDLIDRWKESGGPAREQRGHRNRKALLRNHID